LIIFRKEQDMTTHEWLLVANIILLMPIAMAALLYVVAARKEARNVLAASREAHPLKWLAATVALSTLQLSGVPNRPVLCKRSQAMVRLPAPMWRQTIQIARL
jgi:hypothetical protein